MEIWLIPVDCCQEVNALFQVWRELTRDRDLGTRVLGTQVPRLRSALDDSSAGEELLASGISPTQANGGLEWGTRQPTSHNRDVGHPALAVQRSLLSHEKQKRGIDYSDFVKRGLHSSVGA